MSRCFNVPSCSRIAPDASRPEPPGVFALLLRPKVKFYFTLGNPTVDLSKQLSIYSEDARVDSHTPVRSSIARYRNKNTGSPAFSTQNYNNHLDRLKCTQKLSPAPTWMPAGWQDLRYPLEILFDSRVTGAGTIPPSFIRTRQRRITIITGTN